MTNPVDLIVSGVTDYNGIKSLENDLVISGPCEVSITFNGETHSTYVLSSVHVQEAERLEIDSEGGFPRVAHNRLVISGIPT